MERDPAATSKLEILTSYPGLHALWLHRLAHRLYRAGVPILPRWISSQMDGVVATTISTTQAMRAGTAHMISVEM